MYSIKRTDAFAAWLDGLKDRMTRVRLNRRLDRAIRGHLGDVRPVGEGVFEIREHFEPGWRMYYVMHGMQVIVMLGGGDKSSQAADIKAAIRLASQIEE